MTTLNHWMPLQMSWSTKQVMCSELVMLPFQPIVLG